MPQRRLGFCGSDAVVGTEPVCDTMIANRIRDALLSEDGCVHIDSMGSQVWQAHGP
jgi:hypothetical protein